MKHKATKISSKKFSTSACLLLLTFSSAWVDPCFGITDIKWNAPSGNWNLPGNWNPTEVPNAVDAIADFNGFITADTTVTVNGSITVGYIAFDNSTYQYTIANVVGDGLTLEVTPTSLQMNAQITVLAGDHVISSPLQLDSPLYTNISSNNSLSQQGVVSGSNSLQKDGQGTLFLTGVNTYIGTTTITEGILSISDDNNLGDPANIIAMDGGILEVTNTMSSPRDINITGSGTFLIVPGASGGFTDATFSGLISGDSLLKDGPDTLLLTNTSNSYSDTTILGGTLVITNGLQIGSGDLTFASLGSGGVPPTLQISSTSVDIHNAIHLGQGSAGNTEAHFFVSAGTTANLFSTIDGAGSLYKDGPGNFFPNGTATYTGETFINEGTIGINFSDQIGPGDITFGNPGGTLGTYANITLPQPIHLDADGTIFILDLAGEVTMTLPGDIDGSGGLIFGGPFETFTSGGYLALSGTNTYLGGTTINDGTLMVLSTASLPFEGDVTMNNLSTSLRLPTFLDISAGSSENYTIGSLTGTGNPTILLGDNTLTVTGGLTTYDGAINGTSGSNLTISGGALNLTGDSTFDSTTVGSVGGTGILYVNGTVTNALSFTVGPGSFLGGIGTIFGNVDIYGTHAPGNSIGTHSIVGNYELFSTSTLEIEVDPVTSDLVLVSGTATIDPGATLDLHFDAGVYNLNSTWVILTAVSPVSGTFTTVTAVNSPLANLVVLYNPALDPTSVVLSLAAFSPFSTIANQGNPGAVAACVDTSTPATGSDFATIISYLDTQSEEFLYDAFNQMQPTAFKALAVSQQNIFLEVENALSKRYESYFSTYCQEKQRKKPSVWLDTFGSTQTQDSRMVAAYSPEPSYTTKTWGALLGVDGLVYDHYTLGACTGYSRGNLSMHSNAGKGHIQSFYFGPYFQYGRNNTKIKPFINASLLGEANWYHTDRNIHFGDINRTAHSSHTGEGLLFHVGGGTWFPTGKFQIAPFVNFDLITMKEGAHTEHGADSLDLHVESSVYQFNQIEGGVIVRTCKRYSKALLIPEVSFSVLYEDRSQGEYYNASLVDSNSCYSHVKGYYPDRTLFIPAAELKALFLDDQLTASLYFQGKYGDGFEQEELGVQLVWNF